MGPASRGPVSLRTETRTTTTTRTDSKGNTKVKKEVEEIHYVDNKPVKLKWWERLWIKGLSVHERQAFLAKKLKQIERKEAKKTRGRAAN